MHFYALVTDVAITCTRRRKSGRRKPEAIASATEGSADRRNPADWAFYFYATDLFLGIADQSDIRIDASGSPAVSRKWLGRLGSTAGCEI
jgi:hypothetical protein